MRAAIRTVDRYSHLRSGQNGTVFGTVPKPRTNLTVSISTKRGLQVGWGLFWHSIEAWLRGDRRITFWIEEEAE